MEKVIVTRHRALIAHIISTGLADADTPVIAHAKADDVRGKHVIGVLPIHLAAQAAKLTCVNINIPHELRGAVLSPEQLRRWATAPKTYVVQEVKE